MNDKTKELGIILLRAYIIRKLSQGIVLPNLTEIALISLSISTKVRPISIDFLR